MSEEPPPDKPKPGSLRDRIAAFENKATSSGPKPAPPAPRPKPAGLTWKPKLPSPPSSPPADPGLSSPERGINRAGMSASDAKESIGKAGSLKDRMAALQGKGAFGAPPPPPLAPKPALEKPKWKPPPVISAPADDDVDTPLEGHDPVKSPIIVPKSPTEDPADSGGDRQTSQGDVGDESPENDPEEEERQRRATIAARMARLGGTRVGMAPPVFGKKPPVRKDSTPKEDIPVVETPNEEVPHVDVAAEAVSERECFLQDPVCDKYSF